jgi:CheY-like chemotaxis protein/two-component sensor histidine kinase
MIEPLLIENNILIVDDNPKNLQVLGSILRANNFDIEFATNGMAALELLKLKNFDMILLDINMPEMDGYTVCEKIRTNPDLIKMPIIFLTAEYSKESVIKGFEVGAQDYVTKPFDSRELLMRVKTHLNLKNSIEKVNALNNSLEEKVSRRTQQLNLALQKADESNRLKTVFLQNIAHEIRTPMNGIFGFMDLLRNPDINEIQREKYFDVVQQSGFRLLNTINDLIEISVIETEQNHVNNSVFDLEKLMSSFLDNYKPKADKKGIELNYYGKIYDDNAIINSDKNKIAVILKNLIDNAIKFTNKGQIEYGSFVDHNNLIIFVKDSGIGIPKNRENAIFDRFVHANLEITRPNEGLGVGLSIVKAHVDALGGRIDVESNSGEGTNFIVSIPYIKAAISAPTNLSKKLANPLPSDITILMVDDIDTNLMVLEYMLQGGNRKLIKAFDGETAVLEAKNNPEIAIIFMDLKMPGIGGLEATINIRKFNKTVPIIAQTAYDFAENQKAALDAGCNAFISKPIMRDELYMQINKYL